MAEDNKLKETIEAGNFDKKFKNYLRDCYTYGFKNSTYYAGSVDDDWTLLKNILRDYVDWSDDDKKKEVMYITQDSEALDINPFHRVYRFCHHRNHFPSYFFHTVASLSMPRISLRDGVKTLNTSQNIKDQIDDELWGSEENVQKEIDKAYDKIESKNKDTIKRLSEQINDIDNKEKEQGKTNYSNPEKERLNNEIKKLNNKKEALKADKSNRIDYLNSIFDEDFEKFKDFLKQEGLDDEDLVVFEKIKQWEITLKTSQLVGFYQGSFFKSSDPNKTLNQRLTDFKDLGILKQNKDNNNKLADNRWSISSLTMEGIIEAGTMVNGDFEQHFQYLLDFFSKYYMFGELGTFLLDRMQMEYHSPFRFKHEYFMQSLNDFNIIDLIEAIEDQKWCYITYNHGTEDCEMKLLCFPLEIRVSSVTGRELVMYYEPIRRSYSALRVEFIDSIEYYDNDKIREVLQDVLSVTTENIDSDISNAKWALGHSWGASTPGAQEGNAKQKTPLKSVKLIISYNEKTEPYIKDRIYRERRKGSVSELSKSELQYTNEVTDAAELRPWIRSFYSRIEECDGLDSDQYTVRADVNRMVAAAKKEVLDKPDQKSTTHQPAWETLDEIMSKAGSGEVARAHEKLFNVIFSVYYYMLANVFNRLCSDDDLQNNSKEELVDRIRRDIAEEKDDPLRILEQEMGEKSEDYLSKKIEDYFVNDGYIYEPNEEEDEYGFEFKFENEEDFLSVDFYRELVPITVLEIRWLKTVLADPHAKYFLKDEEIEAVEGILDNFSPDTISFPMNKIVHHDRYIYPEEDMQTERKVINDFLDGISKKEVLMITYSSDMEGTVYGEYIPVYLEFSQRKSHFQAYCVDVKTGDIVAINLASVLTVETRSAISKKETEEIKSADKKINDYRMARYKTVTIQFYDKFNLADRILTEFSPWKKSCRYNKENELYTLTISYQQDDERELVMRLLGYGADIYIDQSQPIGEEIRNRVGKQQNLFENNLKM